MLHHALLRSSLHVLFRASVTPWAALRIQRIAAQVARASTYTGKPEYSPEDLTQQWASYRRARRWRYFRNFTFLSLGFFPVWLLLHPPDDPLLSEALSHNLANLPQVRQLLDDAATKPLDQCYAEIDLSRRGSASLTDKTLKGGNLLGPQRAFWSDSEQELLVFVWFGVLLNGWPGVVHGGAIGTVISDAMSVAAGCTRPSIAGKNGYQLFKPMHSRSFEFRFPSRPFVAKHYLYEADEHSKLLCDSRTTSAPRLGRRSGTVSASEGVKPR